MTKEEIKMKKAMALISLAIFVVLLFVSCAGMDSTGVNTDIVSDTAVITNNESKVEYNVCLESYDSYLYEIFKQETPKTQTSYLTPTMHDGEYEMISIGDTTIEARLVETYVGPITNGSHFVTRDEELLIILRNNNDPYNFLIKRYDIDSDRVVKKYAEDELTEENLYEHCLDCIDD